MGAHDHPHGHAGHHHVGPDADGRRLAVALGLIGALMVAELVAGLLAGSLALLSDAAHMLTDAGALALALWALRLARRPAAGAFTFGLKRAETLSAQVNGATLGVLGALIVVEGVRRLVDPPDVDGGPVLVVALVGVAVNLAATRVVAGADRSSLNVEGAFQHLVTDLAAFVATAVAGAVVLLTGFDRADGLASLLVAALMLHAAWGLLREAGRVVLEAAPRGVDPEAIGRAMVADPAVVEVHDLHVWELGAGFPALAAHVLVDAASDCHGARRRLERVIADDFGIVHTTLQVDHVGGELLALEGLDALSAAPAGPEPPTRTA